jgi:hypothetical protein
MPCKHLLTTVPAEVARRVTVVSSLPPAEVALFRSSTTIADWEQDAYGGLKERWNVEHCPTLVVLDAAGRKRFILDARHHQPADAWRLTVEELDKARVRG